MSNPAKIKSLIVFFGIVLLSLGLAASSIAKTPGHLYVFHYENVLGTSLELKVVATSEAQSEKAEEAALAEIDREAHILSSWDPQSEFSNWFRTKNQPVHVSPELFEVFSLFDKWRGMTGGAGCQVPARRAPAGAIPRVRQ